MHIRPWVISVVWITLSFPASLQGDGEGHAHGAGASSAAPHHPADWRFTMPRGNSAKGRAIFEKFECYNCHTIDGEKFPAPVDYDGPELSQMAPLHPWEFFAESIINPNAVVAKEHRRADGKSPMFPDHLENMTVREFIDLTAYVATLKPSTAKKNVAGIGKVIAINLTNAEVVLDHGRLQGFMDAMMMGYKVSAANMLEGLQPGDAVRFSIDPDKNTIVKISKVEN